MTNEQIVTDYMDGLSYKAIAAKHGVSVGLVGSRLSYLRRRGVRLDHRTHAGSAALDVGALNILVASKS